MASAIEQARKAGYTDAEIADHLASKAPGGFDINAARQAGYGDAQLIVFLTEKSPLNGGKARVEDSAPSNVSPEILGLRRGAEARSRAETENVLAINRENNPAYGNGGFQNAVAGFGKAFVDTGRGIRQALTPDTIGGIPTTAYQQQQQKEIDEAAVQDASLTNTVGGFSGQLAGGVAQALPAAFIPGANTALGATAVGGIFGAAQPVETGGSRLKNTALGAGAGAGSVLAARTLGAAVRGGKSAFEPFTKAGQERIAGRTLERFGVTPADMQGVTNQPTATGARTTLAEQIQRPEGAAAAARLQDSVRVSNPEQAAKFATRETENNAARVATLERNAAPRDTAAAARSQTTRGLYKTAESDLVAPQQLAALMQRPAAQRAATKASETLANSGAQVQPNSVQFLHEMKLSMDDEIARLMNGQPRATTVNEAMSIRAAQAELVKVIEAASPNYAQARTAYRDLSKPVNQADIAGEVLERGATTTSDLAGNVQLQPGKLTKAIADEGALMKSATGRDLGGDLSKVLTKQQLDDIRNVVGEVDRAGAVARAANGPGSATAQRLASTNILSEVVRGSGITPSVVDAPLSQALMRPIQFIYSGVPEQRIQATLADLILNPQLAAKAMVAITPKQRTAIMRIISSPLLQQAARQTLPSASQANQ